MKLLGIVAAGAFSVAVAILTAMFWIAILHTAWAWWTA
jgi:hypothetical protein